MVYSITDFEEQNKISADRVQPHATATYYWKNRRQLMKTGYRQYIDGTSDGQVLRTDDLTSDGQVSA